MLQSPSALRRRAASLGKARASNSASATVVPGGSPDGGFCARRLLSLNLPIAPVPEVDFGAGSEGGNGGAVTVNMASVGWINVSRIVPCFPSSEVSRGTVAGPRRAEVVPTCSNEPRSPVQPSPAETSFPSAQCPVPSAQPAGQQGRAGARGYAAFRPGDGKRPHKRGKDRFSLQVNLQVEVQVQVRAPTTGQPPSTATSWMEPKVPAESLYCTYEGTWGTNLNIAHPYPPRHGFTPNKQQAFVFHHLVARSSRLLWPARRPHSRSPSFTRRRTCLFAAIMKLTLLLVAAAAAVVTAAPIGPSGPCPDFKVDAILNGQMDASECCSYGRCKGDVVISVGN
ncbi:hypothetical protein G7046_g8735 [Stylonectria norvegica]|nr:hypothetical protein G7046_g8735 [Stylonectria norvegica]